MANNSLYDGIIRPQGGIYEPTGADVYKGIVPTSSGGGLTSRKVNTVPINPVTGNPVTQTASSGPSQNQMQAIRDMSYYGGNLPTSYAPGASSGMGSLSPALAYAGSPGANQGPGPLMGGNQALAQALMGGDGTADWSIGNQGATANVPPSRPSILPALPAGLTGLLSTAFNNSPVGKGLALLKAIPGKSEPTAYAQSPAGSNPSVHAALVAQGDKTVSRQKQKERGVFSKTQAGGSIAD